MQSTKAQGGSGEPSGADRLLNHALSMHPLHQSGTPRAVFLSPANQYRPLLGEIPGIATHLLQVRCRYKNAFEEQFGLAAYARWTRRRQAQSSSFCVLAANSTFQEDSQRRVANQQAFMIFAQSSVI